MADERSRYPDPVAQAAWDVLRQDGKEKTASAPNATSSPGAPKTGEHPGTKILDYVALGFILALPGAALEAYFRDADSINWKKTLVAIIACWMAGGLLVLVSQKWQAWWSENWPYLISLENRFWVKAVIVGASIGGSLALASALSDEKAAIGFTQQQVEEKIVSAKAPIQTELEAEKQKISSLQSQLEVFEKERDQARQPQNSGTPVIPAMPNSPDSYQLTESEIRKLRDEIFAIRNSLPVHIVLSTAEDTGARRMTNGLAKAIGLGGISTDGVSVGYPVTPQETGISIRVGTLQNIPDGAKKLAEAIKSVTGVEPKYTAYPQIGPGDFAIFVGTDPKEN